MPKKETTIDDLAVMVQKEETYSNHEQRIERLEDDVKWLKGQLTLGESRRRNF